MEDLELEFTKMEATGNDYIYIDCIRRNINLDMIRPHIKYLCDRNFGIGSDGVIFIMPSSVAIAKMIMYNKDGTEAKICGDGIRSVAKYLYENQFTKKDEFQIETKSGIRNLKLHINQGNIDSISVNMGYPMFNPKLIPVITEKSFFLNEDVIVDKEIYKTTCVSIGNPHAVIFTKHIRNLKLYNIGPKIETYYLFPERVNAEFIEKIDDKSIRMRIWERGSGETLSCGSGACASVAAAVMVGELRKNTPIQVEQAGGNIQVEYNDQEGMILTGPAKKVYDGKILLKKRV